MLPESDFKENGPQLRGQRFLVKKEGRFEVCNDVSQPRMQMVFAKIADAINRRDYAEAAIRWSQVNAMSIFRKDNFDPDQPRNAHGEWSASGSNKNDPDKPSNQRQSVSVGYCKIVKQLCIAEPLKHFQHKTSG